MSLVAGSALTSITLTAENDVTFGEVGAIISFTVTVDSTDAVIEMNYADGFVTLAMDCDCTEFDIAHRFTSRGNFTVVAKACDGSTELTDSLDITIWPAVPNITASTNGIVVLPANGLVNFYVDVAENVTGYYVSCDVDFGDGDSTYTYIGELGMGSTLITSHDYTESVEMNVTIICENMVSNSETTAQVLVYGPISDPHLLGDSYWMTDIQNSLEITAEGGQMSPTYMIGMGDGQTNVILKSSHADFYFDHIYSIAGDYSVNLTVSDNVTAATCSDTTVMAMIYVQNNISDLSITADPISVIYPNSYINYTISINGSEAMLYPPSNMSCEINYGDGVTNTIHYGDIIVPFENNITHFHNALTDALQLVEVNCFNQINSENATIQVIVNKGIEDPRIDVAPPFFDYYFPVGDLIHFNVTALYGGAGAKYVITYGDGSISVSSADSHQNFSTEHIYVSAGEYTLGLTVFDDRELCILDSEVPTLYLQNPVIGLSVELEVSGPLVYPYSLANYTVSANGSVDYPPTNVTCTFTFFDGSEESVFWPSADVNTNVVVSHFHEAGDSEKQNVTIDCRNDISNQTFEVEITIYAVIQDAEITLENNISSTDAYYSSKEAVYFFILAKHGETGASYEIDYGDYNSVILSKSEHENFNISHLFPGAGVFTVTLTVSDEYVTLPSLTLSPVNVQNEISNLTVSLPETEILVYPVNSLANFSIVVNGSEAELYPPSNVTCQFDFGSGVIENNYLGTIYSGNETIIQHAFLEGEHSVSINCSNQVSFSYFELNVTVVGVLLDPKIALTDITAGPYFPSEDVLSFNITALAGGLKTQYTVNFQDGVTRVIELVEHRNFSLSHQFVFPGVYLVTLHACDSYTNEIVFLDQTIHVLNPVTGLSVELKGSGPLVYPYSLANYTVSANGTVVEDNPPTNVTCTFTFFDGSEESVFWPNAEVSTSVEVSHFHEAGDSAKQNVTIDCNNEISNQTFQVEITVFSVIQDAEITLENNISGVDVYYSSNEAVYFFVLAKHGELGASYEIDYDDYTSVILTKSQHEDFNISHFFTDAGVFTVTLTVSDEYVTLPSVTLSPVNVQNEIANLTVSLPETEILVNPQNTLANFSIVVNGSEAELFPPSNVTCQFDFGGGVIEDNYLGIIYSNTETIIQHAFPEGEHVVTVNCSNRVSFSYFELNVTVLGALVNPEISLTDKTAGLYFPSGEVLSFNITALAGGLLTHYKVNFQDGVTREFELEQHTNFSITHQFLFPGVFLVSLHACDAYTNEKTYLDQTITILHPVVDFYVFEEEYGSYVYPDTTVTFNINVTGEESETNPPTNVTCIIDFGDDTTEEEVYVGTVSNGYNMTLDHFYDRDVSQEFTAEINCSNIVSYDNFTIDLQIHNPIFEVTFLLIGPSSVDVLQVINISVDATYGEFETHYRIEFDDGEEDVRQYAEHQAFWVTHSYAAGGVYHPNIFANDTYANETVILAETIYVMGPLGNLTLTVITEEMIPDGKIQLFLESDEKSEPTDVKCALEVTGQPIEEELTVEFNSSRIANLTRYLDRNSIGNVTAFMNCSNLRSEANASVVFEMVEMIENLNITVQSAYIIGLHEITTFLVELEYGSGVSFWMVYDDGTQKEEHYVNMEKNLTVTHVYTITGHFNVSVEAVNSKDNISAHLDELIDVYLDVKYFNLISDSPRPLPPGLFKFTLQPNMSHLPEALEAQWDFTDDNITTEILSEFVPSQRESHIMIHEYISTDYVGDFTVILNVSNPISFQMMEANLTMVEIITVPAIVSDMIIAGLDEDVVFTLNVVTGSHVNYTINYADGTPEEEEIHVEEDLLNREVTFTHAFAAHGNYTALFEAANIFSLVDSQTAVPVHVMPLIPPLNLTGITPLLTPPGDIQLVLTTTDQHLPFGQNVLCTYNYGYGAPEEVPYFPLELPIDQSNHYKPSAQTIVEELIVLVECHNDKYGGEANTTLEIERNEIQLGVLEDDGPGMVDLTITITLEIINYAVDPCFEFTFLGWWREEFEGDTDIRARRVIIGKAADCQLMLASPHDEFVAQNTETDVVTYTTIFTEWDVYNVSVVAQNSISTDSTDHRFIILTDECYRPEVHLGLEGLTIDSPREVEFSKVFSIYGKAETNCTFEHSFISKWKLYAIDKLGNSQLLDIPLTKTLTMTFTPKQLPIGLYTLILRVSLTALPMEVYTEAEVFIDVVATPLEIEIVGGEQDVAVKYSDVNITGLARDPDLDNPEDMRGMIFTWWCREDPMPPSGVLTTNWSLAPSNGFIDECFNGRGGEDVVVADNVLMIPSSVLNHDVRQTDNYTFSMHVEKEGGVRWEYTSLWLTFSDVEPLKLHIR